MKEIPNYPADDGRQESRNEEKFIRVDNLADEILDQIGSDRSSNIRTLYDATWEDDENKRYELRKVQQDGGWFAYFLDVHEPFKHKPFKRFIYNHKKRATTEYGRDDNGQLQPIDTLPIEAEQNMVDHLRSSGVTPSRKSKPFTTEDIIFWDIACHIIAEQDSVQAVMRRGYDTSDRALHYELRDRAREAICAIEPNLPGDLINRIIHYADIEAYPKEEW